MSAGRSRKVDAVLKANTAVAVGASSPPRNVDLEVIGGGLQEERPAEHQTGSFYSNSRWSPVAADSYDATLAKINRASAARYEKIKAMLAAASPAPDSESFSEMLKRLGAELQPIDDAARAEDPNFEETPKDKPAVKRPPAAYEPAITPALKLPEPSRSPINTDPPPAFQTIPEFENPTPELILSLLGKRSPYHVSNSINKLLENADPVLKKKIAIFFAKDFEFSPDKILALAERYDNEEAGEQSPRKSVNQRLQFSKAQKSYIPITKYSLKDSGLSWRDLFYTKYFLDRYPELSKKTHDEFVLNAKRSRETPTYVLFSNAAKVAVEKHPMVAAAALMIASTIVLPTVLDVSAAMVEQGAEQIGITIDVPTLIEQGAEQIGYKIDFPTLQYPRFENLADTADKAAKPALRAIYLQAAKVAEIVNEPFDRMSHPDRHALEILNEWKAGDLNARLELDTGPEELGRFNLVIYKITEHEIDDNHNDGIPVTIVYAESEKLRIGLGTLHHHDDTIYASKFLLYDQLPVVGLNLSNEYSPFLAITVDEWLELLSDFEKNNPDINTAHVYPIIVPTSDPSQTDEPIRIWTNKAGEFPPRRFTPMY